MRRLAVIAACLFGTHRANAVDGVGLGEIFPGFGVVAWGLFVGVPFWLFYRFVRSQSNGDPVRLRRVLQILFAIAFAFPFAMDAAASRYASYLCSTEGSTSIHVSTSDWQGPATGPPARPQLSERLVVRHRALGVQEYEYRLMEDVSGTTLMYSRAFFSTRYAVPYGCASNDKYWRAREAFLGRADIRRVVSQ